MDAQGGILADNGCVTGVLHQLLCIECGFAREEFLVFHRGNGNDKTGSLATHHRIIKEMSQRQLGQHYSSVAGMEGEEWQIASIP